MPRLLGTAAVLLLAVAPAAHAKGCSQLHQRDLAPAKHVRLVERANGDGGHDLVGCILPRGGLYLIASSTEYETGSSEYTLLGVRREKVIVAASYGNEYGGASRTFVADIRTTATYTVVSRPGPPGEQESVAAWRLNRIGQAAAVLRTPSSAAVVGFSGTGARTELDRAEPSEIDDASLRLRGSTVSWTHGGQQRSFTLSG
jgi:hypothetical protein